MLASSGGSVYFVYVAEEWSSGQYKLDSDCVPLPSAQLKIELKVVHSSDKTLKYLCVHIIN